MATQKKPRKKPVVRNWYEGLEPNVAALVRELIAVRQDPSDEQLAEAVDLAEGHTIEVLGFDEADRRRLEAAVEDLKSETAAADPRHRFLREHDRLRMASLLKRIYEEGEHTRYQHRFLDDTNYAPYPLYVDFDEIAGLTNPDFAQKTIGKQCVAFANLAEDPKSDPSECYAHLAIDLQTTTVYLVEPSGSPELIADDLEAFLARLKRA